MIRSARLAALLPALAAGTAFAHPGHGADEATLLGALMHWLSDAEHLAVVLAVGLLAVAVWSVARRALARA